MDCEAYQAELPGLLYGEVDAEVRPTIEDHRRGCGACDALTRELEAVKGGLPALRPPPLLALRLKLAARDELLSRPPGEPGAASARAGEGPTLKVVTVVVLAACVGVVGFGLGIAFQDRRQQDGAQPRVPVPTTPSDVEPPWLDPSTDPSPSKTPPRTPPRAPEAWQKVLFDTAAGMRADGDARQAAEFFERARAVMPEGPLAAAAMVGRAEALLALGRRDEADRLLEEARRGILGGVLVGGPTLLQRIAELQEAPR